MTIPPPQRLPFRSGLGWFPVLAGLFLGWSACAKRPAGAVVLSSELFELAVHPSPTDERGLFEWTLRHAGQDWTVRTRIPDLSKTSTLASLAARAILDRYLTWESPYLFIREDTGPREGSRASVDHVFKCEGSTVVRLGTLAAPSGSVPGFQHASDRSGDRFADIYDRLEFSPLASPNRGPAFAIELREQNGRFRVDLEATWGRNRGEYEFRRKQLRAFAESEEPESRKRGAENGRPPTATEEADRARALAARRAARAEALFCLSITRYCDQDDEYFQVLESARKAVESIDELVQEVETIVPGELAATRDEILRANPALVNLFKESSDDPPEPTLPSPPSRRNPGFGLSESTE